MTEQVLMYAAGALSEAEAQEVRHHLDTGCPHCAGLMAEAQATVAMLAHTLPPATPSPETVGRLMNRVNEEKLAPVAAHKAHPAAAQAQAAPWWALIAIPSAIAAAVAAGVAIFFAFRLAPLQPLQPTPTQEVSTNQGQLIGLLTAELERDEHAISALRTTQQTQMADWVTDPSLKVISMNGTDKQPATAVGRVLWDVDKGVWHFFACDMKPAVAGKTYELWFVSSDGKMALPAGGFDPTAQGEAMLTCNVPPAIASRLTIAAVTDEPAGQQITAPTGSFQLKGSLP